MAEPRRNRPRNALLTGIKIYLNGAPHYPAPEARLCDEEGTKRWRRQKRCIATNEEGNLLLLLLVREREREKEEKGKLRNGEGGDDRGGGWLFFLSRTHNATSEQRGGEQIRHVFKYNTDSLASRQSTARGMRASKGVRDGSNRP